MNLKLESHENELPLFTEFIPPLKTAYLAFCIIEPYARKVLANFLITLSVLKMLHYVLESGSIFVKFLQIWLEDPASDDNEHFNDQD